MVEIKDDFLIVENGSGIELSGLCLVGAKVIDSEFTRIDDCEIRNPNSMRRIYDHNKQER